MNKKENPNPVFQTKEQRMQQAIARRQKETEEVVKKREAESANRKRFIEQAKAESSHDKDRKDRRDTWKRDDNENRKSRREKRKRDDDEIDGDKDEKKVEDRNLGDREKESELKMIREIYTGTIKKKKRVRRPNERKFVFDWAAEEDNSVDYNPIYNEKHTVQLFGRGHMGGVDMQQERKERSKFYEEHMKKNAEKAGRKYEVKKLEESHDVRHWSQKNLDEMTKRDYLILREEFSISIRGENVPNPIRFWAEANLPRSILDTITSLGYKEPTPIQRQAIPIGLENRDVIGISQTGSGKTLAFLFPLLVWIASQPNINNREEADQGPYAIIMAPTRELVLQIKEEADQFASSLNIKTVAIIGGESLTQQVFSLQKGCSIVIATPGRLVDVLENRYLVLSRCTYIVLDEADRMIEDGFEVDMQKILGYMPLSNQKSNIDESENDAMLTDDISEKKFRQTVMFTATMPPAVEKLANLYLRNPYRVKVGDVDKPVDRVEQIVHFVSENEKKKKLLEILNQRASPPIMVFVETQGTASALANDLDRKGWKASALHGGMRQDQRGKALDSFKSGEKDILVATSVLGRGIDIKNVSLVINYDMASTIQTYIHRIGRTGRAGKKGKAVTFVTKDDSPLFYDLKKLLTSSPVSVCPHALATHPEAQHKPGTVVNRRNREEKLMD